MPSVCLRTHLQKSINSKISLCKIEIIFKLANVYGLKDNEPLCVWTNIGYKFACARCNATFYGETCHHFKVKVGEHSDITKKRSKSQKNQHFEVQYDDVQPTRFF